MLVQQIDDKINNEKPWFKDYKFHVIETIEQLKRLVDICVQKKLCSVDVETTGVDSRVYPDAYFEDGVKTRHGIRTVDTIAGVCISMDGYNGYYVPLAHEPPDSGNLPWDPAWDELTRIVQNCKCLLHGSKFDFEFLYPVTGKDFWKKSEYEDMLLMSKVINPLKGSPNGLKPLTKIHFGVDMIEIHELFSPEKREQLKKEKKGLNFALLHPKEGKEYGCSDGIFTYKMYFALKDKLSPSDMEIYDLEKSFGNVIREMERNRVHLDMDKVRELYRECKNELRGVGDAIRDFIEAKTGNSGRWKTLNVGSTQQLNHALFLDSEGLKLKPTAEMLNPGGDEAGGGEAPDDDDDDDDEEDVKGPKMFKLKDEIIKTLDKAYGKDYRITRPANEDKADKPKSESLFDMILEYRHYVKMDGSYIGKFMLSHDKYGDVRPDFNQMGTDTARLSAKAGKIENGYSGVNFQGIPRDSDEDKPELFKKIRECIAPRPGWILVKLDFSGEELRVVTNLSGDKVWTKSFLYEDGDVHSITARTLFGKAEVNKDERNRGKRSNFAFIYGGGAGAIQRNIPGCSMEDAQRHMENLKRDVPELMGYVEHQKAFARKNKCIYTAFGRRIPIQNIDSPIQGLRRKAERCAINYTIQSTSADIIKYAMCFVDKQLRTLGWKERCRYVLTVHDEVVFEIRPEYLMEIIRKLDEWMTLPWKLPKAHGREWIVPLLTEPGIDINWKARYDYFKMVDGFPPIKKSDIDENGKYLGKLKKDEYFANGRVYQNIPEFLKSWIQVLNRVDGLPVIQESASPPISPESEIKVTKLPGPGLMKVPENPTIHEVPGLGKFLVDVMTGKMKEEKPVPPVEPNPVEPNPVVVPAKHDPDKPKESHISDDISLDIVPSLSDVDTKVVETPHTNGTSGPAIPAPKVEPFTWTLRAKPTEVVLRKLHAIVILTEGDQPLRIISLQGKVIFSEDEGVKVNPIEFKIICSMFGIG